MRIFFIFLVLCHTLAFQITNNLRQHWEEWKVKQRKSYSEIENQFRFQIFIDNLEMINSHNEKARRGEESYFLGVNQMLDQLPQEIRAARNGLRKSNSRKHQNLSVATFIPPENLLLPDSIDWRKKGAVTAVKNQGNCGSCWAFSATGALEGQQFRKTGKLVSLSEQNLMDCSWDYGNDGCGGGYMNQAFEYVRDNKGIDTEESYPYEETDDFCKFDNKTIGSSSTGFISIQRGRDDDLMKAVSTVGPIAVSMNAGTREFFHYSKGIFNSKTCSPNDLDHGVLLVGYGSENGQDYWILKNSWGVGWGEKGYFRMSRNTNNLCGISEDASFPLV